MENKTENKKTKTEVKRPMIAEAISENRDFRYLCNKCSLYEEYCKYKNGNYRRNNYYYKPRPKFHSSPGERIGKRTMYFGVELEVEPMGGRDGNGNICTCSDCVPPKTSQSAIYCMSRSIGSLCYIKSDGSLRNGGFEIVSHPFTWRWLKENMRAFDPIWELKKKFMADDADSNAGMHVHVSRMALSPYAMFKMSKFMLNAGYHTILPVSGRRSLSELRRWASTTTAVTGNQEQFSKFIGKEVKELGGGRYSRDMARGVFINILPRNTYEIRIFKGTLHRNIFLKNMEYIHSLIEFSKWNRLADMTLCKYLDFLFLNRGEYRNLLEHLYSHGITSGDYRKMVENKNKRSKKRSESKCA